MRITIDELWRGALAPCDRCGEADPEIQKLLELMVRNAEKLKGQIGPSQRKIFCNYADCAEEYAGLIAGQAFSIGFSLGCRLLSEALCGGDDLTQTV